MTSEIRVNKITHTAGVGTITSNADGIVIAGIVTANNFSGNLTGDVTGDVTGSGANLTNIPAAQLTGTLPAISGANLTSLPAQATIANNSDNRVITGGSGVNLNGEANLTFNGTNLLTVHVPSATGEPAINFTNSDTGTGTSNGFGIGINDAESPYIFNRENTDIRIATNNTERFRIGSSGQFGIGGATYGTSGQVLTSGGASAAPTWGTISAAAGSVYDTFHGQGFSGSAGNGYITSGWGKPGGPGGSWANGPSGKLITESSGIFSFPSTGIYYISFQLSGYAQNVNNRIIGNRIYATNSNANPPAHQVAHAEWNTKSFSGIDNGVGYGTAHCAVILKVTNTSNDKVAFWWQSEDNYNIGGGFGQQAIFYKLADL